MNGLQIEKILTTTTSNNAYVQVQFLGDPPGTFSISGDNGNPDTDGSFTLSWESADGADNYEIYYSSNPINGLAPGVFLWKDGLTNKSMLITPLSTDTYYFRMRAVNVSGATWSTNEINFEVIVPPESFDISGDNGTPFDNDGSFTLSWEDSVGADNYSIYWSINPITDTGGATLIEGSLTNNSRLITSFSDGTYYFRVLANNTAGATWSTSTIQLVVLLPPAAISISGDYGNPDPDGEFRLSWTSASTADNYSVYYSASSIPRGADFLLEEGITDLYYDIPQFYEGTYYFRVLSVNEAGSTWSSNEIFVVIQYPPEEFVVTSDAGTPDADGSFTFSWTSSTGADNYTVYEYDQPINEITCDLWVLDEGLTNFSYGIHNRAEGSY